MNEESPNLREVVRYL